MFLIYTLTLSATAFTLRPFELLTSKWSQDLAPEALSFVFPAHIFIFEFCQTHPMWHNWSWNDGNGFNCVDLIPTEQQLKSALSCPLQSSTTDVGARLFYYFLFKEDINMGQNRIRTDSRPVTTTTTTARHRYAPNKVCHLQELLCFPQTKPTTLRAPSNTTW